MRNNTTSGLSLVAFYGAKSETLLSYLSNVQSVIRAHLPRAYVPYENDQLHATLLRLNPIGESRVFSDESHSRLLGEFEKFAGCGAEVQLGGINKDEEYEFTSNNEALHDRQFSIHAGVPFLMGWPNKAAGRDRLNLFRHSLEGMGIQHKAFANGRSYDADVHFTLGRIDERLVSDVDIVECERAVREYMSSHSLVVTLSRNNLALVSYTDRTLPVNFTQVERL